MSFVSQVGVRGCLAFLYFPSFYQVDSPMQIYLFNTMIYENNQLEKFENITWARYRWPLAFLR